MSVTPPDISTALDPTAFQVADTGSSLAQASSIESNTAGISYDWSGVNAALSGLGGVQQAIQQRAQGQGLTAGYAAQEQQSGSANVPQTVADLGKYLIQQSQTASSGALNVANATGTQQAGFANQAEQLQQSAYNARLQMMNSQMQLQAQQFAIQQSLTQATNSLNLANTSLQNDYNAARAAASTSIQAIQLGANAAQTANIMAYVGAGLSAAAAASAAGAAAANNSPAWNNATDVAPNQMTPAQINAPYAATASGMTQFDTSAPASQTQPTSYSNQASQVFNPQGSYL